MPLDEAFYKAYAASDPRKQQAYLAKQPLEKRVAVEQGFKKWQKEQPSALSSLWAGVKQGATLRFGDEIAGYYGALGTLAGRPSGGYTINGQHFDPEVPTIKEGYLAARDEDRARNQKAQDEHSGMYLAGEVGGGILPGVLLPGSNAKQLLSSGAALGAASGAGGSEETSVGGVLEDTVLGAGMGVAGAAVGIGAGKAISKGKEVLGKALASDTISDAAAWQAFKAAQPKGSDLQKIPKEQAVQIGRRLLDEELVTAGKSTKAIAQGVESAKKGAGEQIGSVIKELDAAGKSVPAQSLAQRIMAKADEAYSTSVDDDLRGILAKEAEKLTEKYGEKGISFKDLQALKVAASKKGYAADSRTANAFKDLTNILKQELTEQAQKQSPELAERLSQETARYSDLAPYEKIADAAVAKAEGRGVGLMDVMLGIGGTSAGGPYAGIGAVLINRVVKDRGPQMAAGILNTISKSAKKPGVSGEVAKTLMKNPSRYNKALSRLIEAAGRSEEAFEAVATEVYQTRKSRKSDIP